MNTSQLSATGRKHLHLIECDDNEEVLYEIRKHPIGLVGVYALGLLVTAAIVAATGGLAYLVTGGGLERDLALDSDIGFLRPVVMVLGGLLAVFTLVMTAISAYLYQSNVVYVTSEKVAQVLYSTIFDRKVSQLSIGDIQDVTTTQKGIFARAFNYGTLVIETAGEQANYSFPFTPKPYEASRAIVSAHEENLKKYGN